MYPVLEQIETMSNVEHPPSFDLRNFHGTVSLVFNFTFAEILLGQLADEPVVEVDDDQCNFYIKFGDKLEYFVNGDEDMSITGYYINSKKYIGMSFGVILIPYQTKQYSSLSLQLGYSHSFGFGGGFDLGIGYRI